MTIKTRSASKAEKGTTRLSPNGKMKDSFAEQNKDIEESDVKAEAALNIEGMLKKEKMKNVHLYYKNTRMEN